MSASNPQSILVVAAHPDDETLGCGGMIARMSSLGHKAHVLLLADGVGARNGATDRTRQERLNAAKTANARLGSASVEMLAMPDNRMDGLELLDIVKLVETRIERYRPSMVLTHHAGDVNIDHRIVHDAVIAATRPQPGHPVKTLLFFETPSSTEWRPPNSGAFFQPNWFCDISAFLSSKLAALSAYDEELRPFPHPRSLQAVEHLARWRGAGVGVEAAEAFILGRFLD